MSGAELAPGRRAVPTPDPMEDARALLVIARLLRRARISRGVATTSLSPIGRALAEAVARAEAAAKATERAAALAAVDQAGTRLWQEAGREGVRDLLKVALGGLRPRPR